MLSIGCISKVERCRSRLAQRRAHPRADRSAGRCITCLRKGDTGPAVVRLQELLPKEIDGIYGSTTEALVKSFQRANPPLAIDGVVGEATWAALLDEEPPPPLPSSGWIHGITATLFGASRASSRPMAGHWMTLSRSWRCRYRFSQGSRPTVEVMNEDGDIVAGDDRGCRAVDDHDDYWAKGTRPIAEQCYASKTPLPSGPQKGRVPSNPAGIDLSPSLAMALGIDGMGKVAWRLVS